MSSRLVLATVVLVAVLIGANFTALKFALDHGTPLLIAGMRTVIGSTALLGFAFLRGEVADRYGNVAFHGTQANFGPAMASAARVAVVEVRRLSDEPLSPYGIDLPGVYVQRILPDAAHAREDDS